MDDIRSAFARQGLVRSSDSGILGGVCAGVGRRLGLTPAHHLDEWDQVWRVERMPDHDPSCEGRARLDVGRQQSGTDDKWIASAPMAPTSRSSCSCLQ